MNSLIDYIKKEGSTRDILRLKAKMGDKNAQYDLIAYYKKLQTSFGAFPFRFQSGNFYSFMHTYRIYQLLKELGDLEESKALIGKITNFLEKNQNSDGSWNENTDLLKIPDLPAWLNPENKDARLLTTALCVYIMSIEKPGSSVTQKGISYLKKHQLSDGSFKGFIHTAWIAGAALLGYYGTFYAVGREMALIIDDILDQDHSGSTISWIALSLIFAGFTSDSLPVLSRALDLLQQSQQKDGLWTSEDQGREIETTVDCLITLDLGKKIRLKDYQ